MAVTVLDENGKQIQLEEPYYETRKRQWFGEKPPKKSSDNPSCPDCESNEHVEILMYGHLDSDGVYHYPVYRCRCGREF